MTNEQPHSYRVELGKLIRDIAADLAMNNQSEWAKPGHDNDLRHAIVGAINTHGLDSDGTPGLLPHIQRAIDDGVIKPRSTFNDIPALDGISVVHQLHDWYLTPHDANAVLQLFGLKTMCLEPDDSVAINPAPDVPMPDGVRIFNVEVVLEAIALAKYGPLPDTGQEKYSLHIEVDKMLKRQAVRAGFHDRRLTGRFADGAKCPSPPDDEILDKVYIERDQLAQFAADEWMVTFVQGEQEQDAAAPPAGGAPIESKQRSQAQDETILTLLASKGYDPLALPPYAPGTPGVRAEIKAALGNKGMWGGKTVFRKAWERLSENGDIAYRK